MFKISQSESYSWPVIVELPISGGRTDKQNFDAVFKRLPQSRIKEIGEQIKSEEITDEQLIREIVLGWSGIVGDDGKEVPFSDGALTKLIDIPLVARSLIASWYASISGAKIKN
jgi:hypothetical protein